MAFGRQQIVALALLLLGLPAGVAFAQSGPQGISYHGRILKPGGLPLEDTSVTFTMQIRSPGAEDCLLYSEQHVINMSDSDGVFSLTIGGGTRTGSDFEDTSTLKQVFDNSSGTMSALTCASGTTYSPSNGEYRKLRVSFADTAGSHTLTDDQTVQAVPYALYADTLQGKAADKFVQTNSTSAVLTQSNLESVFQSSTMVTDLLALINGTSTKYTTGAGANFTPAADLSFNAKKITNLADPSSAQDAVTKNYTDTRIGAKDIDLTGVGMGSGDGKVLTWDATNNQWIASSVSTTDTTKLPLAGGTMSGSIGMGGHNITGAGYVTMAAGRYFGLGAFDATTEADLITDVLTPGGNSHKGVTWYNSVSNTIKYWDGSAAVSIATGSDLPAAAGTAAAPAYAFSGNTNTGMFRPTTNEIGFSTNGTERVRIDADGDVGIGIATPAGTLDVQGGTAANDVAGKHIIMEAQDGGAGNADGGVIWLSPGSKTGTGRPGVVVIGTSTHVSWAHGSLPQNGLYVGGSVYALDGVTTNYQYRFGNGTVVLTGATGGGTSTYLATSVSGTEITRVTSNGRFGIGTITPTQKLQVGESGDGTVAIANAWNAFSDRRLKTGIQKIQNACEIVDGLNGYYYHWITGKDRSRQVGVIAQEVEAVLPELVKTGSDGIKTVDYPKLTAVLIEALKERGTEIKQLKEENATIKAYLCTKDPAAGFCP